MQHDRWLQPWVPQGSVVVMTDADLAGDVKHRRSY